VAPLDAKGHIDPTPWRAHRKQCGVRRFWGDEEELGHLVHKPGGKERSRWVFDYDESAEEDGRLSLRLRLPPAGARVPGSVIHQGPRQASLC
jgi:hypothetical protein